MQASRGVWIGVGVAALVLLGIAFVAGRASAPAPAPSTGATDGDGAAAAAAKKQTMWYCSMHPQIRQPMPGKCPICTMDLIPLKDDSGEAGPRELVLSEAAKALAEIETAPVERRFATKTLRMVGKVDYDETRVRTIAAWVDGRIDRLYVDYTGTPVRPGDHLVKLYSPKLLSAQEELLGAKARFESQTSETSAFLQRSNERALNSAREKLRLWGIAAAQIAAIEARGTPEDHIEITAPEGGVVIHKGVHEGMYVKTGAVMYRIADLSHLWVLLEAYESDLTWLRYGQQVAITTEAHPGDEFEGTIAFIAPHVDPKTRTVTVRVNVPNTAGRLRPGMFARGRVQARVAHGGKVMDPALRGKWICPMHPEIVKDGNEPCDICGMDLVKAESLGFVAPAAEAGDRPLVVPVTAVLRTGRRAVVYVAVPGKDRPTYEGREILLGPRADNVYLVRSGLREGEQVVVQGAFKIDSALQIKAKPSMMSMPGSPVRDRPQGSDAARLALAPVYAACLATHEALAADDLAAATGAFAAVGAALQTIDHSLFGGRIHRRWMEIAGVLQSAATAGAAAGDGGGDSDTGIAAARVAFRDLSAGVFALEEAFGHGGTTSYVRMHCPMAFDNAGASWLQTGAKVRNPYFGAAMYGCGSTEEQMPPQVPRAGAPASPTGSRNRPPAPGPHPVPGAKPPKTDPPRAPDPAPPVQTPPPSATAPLAPVWSSYLAAHTALAADDFAGAKAAFAELGRAVAAVAHPALPNDAHGAWSTAAAELAIAATKASAVTELAVLRRVFNRASKAVITLAEGTPSIVSEPLVKAFCPMAFGNAGAHWMQRGEAINNPFFGASMLRCGSVQTRFDAAKGK